MSKYEITNIDPAKGHVSFTITFDDESTHKDTRCDLSYNDPAQLKEELAEYTKTMELAHKNELESVKTNGTEKLIGKPVTV